MKNNNVCQMRELAANLKAIRTGRHLTQGDLAEMCGVTQKQISFYETGKAAPHVSTLTLIANALNVEPGRLIGDTPCHENQD